MEVHESTRRWRPGRQTLTRVDHGRTERRDVAIADTGQGDREETYDPVYDWFDLRRTAPPIPQRRRD